MLATLNVGIVGLGKRGLKHLSEVWLPPRYHVSHYFDSDPNSASPGPLRATSFEELLSPALGIDLVVITTPPDSHFEYARAALTCEKNVIVEKPTALTLEDAETLIELSDRKGCLLITPFNRRLDSDFLVVQRELAAGTLGRIHHFESRVSDEYDGSSTYSQRAEWKKRHPGGGILLDWAPHLLDQLFELFPYEKPQELYCRTARPNGIVDPQLEEQFVIHVAYEGFLAILAATWNATLPLPRWYIVGATGALRLETKPFQGQRKCGVDGALQETPLFPMDAPRSLSALFEEVLSDRSLQQREKHRIRQVTYGIDLARRSARERKILAWRLDSIARSSA